MAPVIKVDGIGKRYQLGATRVDGNLTENIKAGASAVWRRISGKVQTKKRNQEFWALKDISFDVQQGEVVGIIGRNGAGKSTLLKVLSRIVEPTAGKAEIRGRMGSLLEVGTGFHPELTGRENIFLNGSVLGMSQREIKRKFDEIVAFSEIEQFLDTPVKRYSSGMYVRLAFSVAAHLEPELLIVDEVLAVGDATFQRRCIDRMTELARSGRTILFVSHNMQLIPLLCQRAILLEAGRVKAIGTSGQITSDYMTGLIEEGRVGDLKDKPRTGDGRAIFTKAWLVDENGNEAAQFVSGNDLIVRLEIESSVSISSAALAVIIATQHGMRAITSWTKEVGFEFDLEPGVQQFECRFTNVSLRPGHVIMTHLWLSDGEVMDSVENVIVLDVQRNQDQAKLSPDSNQGVVVFDYSWRRISKSETI